MTKKTINVGAEPGNLNDGDSLRGAFIKTQSNFDELYSIFPITDTSLDHSDSDVTGTIAEALATCNATGGGTVFIGPGIFTLSSTTLIIGANCQLIGSGRNATKLKATHQFDAIEISTGTLFTNAYWAIKDLSVSLSNINSGNTISTIPAQSSIGAINNVLVTGGSPNSWGLNMDGVNVISIIDYVYHGEGSGIRWINSANYPINYGDSLIQNVEIALRSSFTTGVQLASPISISGSPNNNRINNVLLSHVEIRTLDGIIKEGTVGIHLRNVARNTLDHIDIERMDTAVFQESKVSGGAIAKGNAFYQVHPLGCTTDYKEAGTPPQEQIVLGGTGQFSSMQQLPSSNISADHSILGTNRVLTAVRPIEAYFDSTSPRTLSVEDSGTIFTNRGATGTVTFQLPSANLNFSIEYEFHLSNTGNAIRIQPASEDIIRPGQTRAGEIYESGIAFGQVLKIRNIDNTNWSILTEQGTWSSI